MALYLNMTNVRKIAHSPRILVVSVFLKNKEIKKEVTCLARVAPTYKGT